eukprot:516831-Alexandrium_andersonii.AAC.1
MAENRSDRLSMACRKASTDRVTEQRVPRRRRSRPRQDMINAPARLSMALSKQGSSAILQPVLQGMA